MHIANWLMDKTSLSCSSFLRAAKPLSLLGRGMERETWRHKLAAPGRVSPIKPSFPQSWRKGLECSEMLICLPPSTQLLPPAQVCWKAASRWQLCPVLKALRDSLLSSLVANTREQLSVQSQVRFEFTVVTEKGYYSLPCNRGLRASKGKKPL